MRNTAQNEQNGTEKPIPIPGETSLFHLIVTAILTVTTFGFDLLAPHGVAGGVPYVLVVLSGWWFHERPAVLYLAFVGSILTILGYYFSPNGGVGWAAQANRSFAIFAIWGTAIVLWMAWKGHSAHHQTSLSEYLNDGRKSTFSYEKQSYFVAALVIIIIATSFVVVSHIEKTTKFDIEQSLKSSLKTSHINIRNQLKGQKNIAIAWAGNPRLQIAVAELLKLPKESKALIESPAQKDLRVWLQPISSTAGYSGFFIIDNNNVNLAASQDNHINVINILNDQKEFLNRVRAGNTLISLPQPSNITFMNIADNVHENSVAMFVATPIRNDDGKIIASLAFRLISDKSFSPTFEVSRLGESGETYAFNNKGILISESRFNEQLKQIKLIPDNSHSELMVSIRDPGVNLTLGQKPLLPRDKQPLTRMAQSATAGESGSDLEGYRDYRGVYVVGAWLWDDDLGFGITSKIDVEEVFTSFRNTQFIIYMFSALSIAILMILAIVSSYARRKITEGSERNQLILNSVGEGIYGVDAMGKTIFVNPAACEMLGYEENELIGQLAHTLIHHTYPDGTPYPREKCHMYAAFTDGKIHHNENEVLWRKDGSSFPIKYTSTPIAKDTDLVGAVITFNDITERRKAEESLHVALKAAKSANRAKSEFLSSMSHELRTPMNSVIGFTQLMESNLREPLTDSQKKCVSNILKGGHHLLELINQILDLSQIESGHLSISIENVNIASVIYECPPIISTTAKKHNISLHIPDVPEIIINADFNRLKQVLLNLLTNAVKYNRDGGRVTLDVEQKEGAVRISVTDTGEGIPEDRQNELFQPFSRLGAENSEIEGTGIGLNITHKLVELMNGHIGYESTLGEGSTFWIEFPVIDTSSATQGATQKEDNTEIINIDIHGRILYIEDNPANIELMNMIINRVTGLHLLTAHNAPLGLDMARNEQPDMIILDINLPGMNGVEALKHLKNNNITKDIPVIALSANAMPEDISRGQKAGFIHYLTKPVDVNEMINIIHELMGGDKS